MKTTYYQFGFLVIVPLLGILPGLKSFKSVPACNPPVLVTKDNPDLTYKKGLLFLQQEPISGTVIERFPDGKLKSVTVYKAGLLHGKAEIWHKNGNKASVIWYENGKPGNFPAHEKISGLQALSPQHNHLP